MEEEKGADVKDEDQKEEAGSPSKLQKQASVEEITEKEKEKAKQAADRAKQTESFVTKSPFKLKSKQYCYWFLC